jgi:hypothetical protein
VFTTRHRAGRLAGVVLGVGVLAGLATSCSSSNASSSEPASSAAVPATLTLESSHSYTPTTPPGGGTDDYHCTLVDPHVTTSSDIVASQFFPQSPEVHHAILFLVPPNLAAAARAADGNGQGWTCFGESPLPGTSFFQVGNTPWLTAWAPGHGLDVVPTGTGVPFPAGSLVVMQIHYNMLVGNDPVRSKLVLRTLPTAGNPLTPLQLDLLPAPPDLPCPAGVSGPLCDRTASVADLAQRFGQDQVRFVNFLEGFCAHTPPTASGADSTSCNWPLSAGRIVRLTAHMHLLGRAMTVVLDAGRPNEQTLLDVNNYNFDYQRSYNLAAPVTVHGGDTLQVNCTYDPSIRQRLPSLRRLPARYVTWGDGSSDEMCLAIVQYLA